MEFSAEQMQAVTVRLQTERLELLPLKALQLEKWLQSTELVEREIMCSYRARPLEGAFRGHVRSQLSAARLDLERRYVWHTQWFVIRRYDRVVTGLAAFKAPPDASGSVELCFDLPPSEDSGDPAAALEALRGWALSQPGVLRVLVKAEDSAAQKQAEGHTRE